MDPIHEHAFQRPHCWQTITMLLDLSVEQQTYVEDCEVCCRPIEITVRAQDGELLGFSVEA